MFSSSRFYFSGPAQILRRPVDVSSIRPAKRLVLLLKKAQTLQQLDQQKQTQQFQNLRRNFSASPSSCFSIDWSGLKAAKFCFNISNLLGGAADKTNTDQYVQTLVESVWNSKMTSLANITAHDVKSVLHEQEQMEEPEIFYSSRSAELICNCLWRSLNFHRENFLGQNNNNNNNRDNNASSSSKVFFTQSRTLQLGLIRSFLGFIGRTMHFELQQQNLLQNSPNNAVQRKLAWEDVHNISFLITRSVSMLPSPEGGIFDEESIPFVNDCLTFCKEIIDSSSTANINKNKNILTLKYPGVFNILSMIHKKSNLHQEVDADRAKAKLKARGNVAVLVSNAIAVLVENSRTCLLEPLNKKQMTEIILSLGFMKIPAPELLVAFSPQIYTLEPKKGYHIETKVDEIKDRRYRQKNNTNVSSSSTTDGSGSLQQFQMHLPKIEVVLINFVLSSASKMPFDPVNELSAHSKKRTNIHQQHVEVFFREKLIALTKFISIQMHQNSNNNNNNSQKNQGHLKRESIFSLNAKPAELDAAFQLVQLFVKYYHRPVESQNNLIASNSSRMSITDKVLFSDFRTFTALFKLCSECLAPTLQAGASWLDLRDIVRIASLGREFASTKQGLTISIVETGKNKQDDKKIATVKNPQGDAENKSKMIEAEFCVALEALEFRIKGKIHQGLKRVHFEAVTKKEDFDKKVIAEKEEAKLRMAACFPFVRDVGLDFKMLNHVSVFVVQWICLAEKQTDGAMNERSVYFEKLTSETFALLVYQFERISKVNDGLKAKQLILALLGEAVNQKNMFVFEEFLKQNLVQHYVSESEIQEMRKILNSKHRENIDAGSSKQNDEYQQNVSEAEDVDSYMDII